jgi:hypothetical protein
VSTKTADNIIHVDRAIDYLPYYVFAAQLNIFIPFLTVCKWHFGAVLDDAWVLALSQFYSPPCQHMRPDLLGFTATTMPYRAEMGNGPYDGNFIFSSLDHKIPLELLYHFIGFS